MRWLLFLSLTLVTLDVLANDPPPLAPLHRFYNSVANQHSYSMDAGEIKRWRSRPTVKEHLVVGLVATEALPGTARLYRAFRGTNQRHFYYTVVNDLHDGVTLEMKNFHAYVWIEPGDGRIPVYSSTWTDGTDVFYTTDRNNVEKLNQKTKAGLGVERLSTGSVPVFYVYPHGDNRQAQPSIARTVPMPDSRAGEASRVATIADSQPSRDASLNQVNDGQTPTAPSLDLADVIERCERSVVRIEVQTDHGDGLGSGFVIAPRTIATNVHVLAGARTAQAIFPNQRKYHIEGVLAVDERRDVAIVTIQGSGSEQLPTLKFSDTLPRKGESIFALGSPLGLSFTATVGVTSAIRPASELGAELGKEDVDGTWIQVDAALSPGNSGGPIIDKSGRVVAMSTLASQGAQNLNFGISGIDVHRVFELGRTNSVTPLRAGMQDVAVRPRGYPDGAESQGVPVDAVQAYVKRGQKEHAGLRGNLLQEISRLRTELREMRAGATSIPSAILRQKRDAEILRTEDPRRRNAHLWFFRSEQVKEEAIATRSEHMKSLTKVSASSSDPKDRDQLFTLLWQYGPRIDTRQNGTVGFLSDCFVVNAYDEHDVLVLFDDALYLLTLDSTTGLSTGREIAPVPVFVNGTATVELPDKPTTSLTLLQAVSEDELRAAIDSTIAPASSAATAAFRTWTDKTGKASVEAAMVEFDGNEVVLRRRDGKTIRVPIDKLSDTDQRLLRQ